MDEYLISWSEDVTEEVYQKWKDIGEPETGFKTFYTPVYRNPPVLIIGYNPGGSTDSFKKKDKERFESGDFSPPTPDEHELIEKEYNLAKAFRNTIFKGRRDLLWKSVKFDMIFFRSTDQEGLEEQLGEDYEDTKQFCYRKTEEIVETIQPESILVYGSTTFKELKRNMKGFREFKEERMTNSRNHKIFQHGEWKGIDIYAIAHPTGLNNESKENIRKSSEKFFMKRKEQ